MTEQLSCQNPNCVDGKVPKLDRLKQPTGEHMTCPTCMGRGAMPTQIPTTVPASALKAGPAHDIPENSQTCSVCNGDRVVNTGLDDTDTYYERCPNCAGRGWVWLDEPERSPPVVAEGVVTRCPDAFRDWLLACPRNVIQKLTMHELRQLWSVAEGVLSERADG